MEESGDEDDFETLIGDGTVHQSRRAVIKPITIKTRRAKGRTK